MSGKPTFSRAKQVTHFHTSHKSTFEGAETQHVKTNMTASVDGTYDIKADEVDFNRTKLIAPKNVLRTEKITVTTANLSVASRNNSVTLFRASPGDTIYDITGNARVSWKKNATIDELRLEVGDLYDPNGFAVSHLASPVGWIWDGTSGTEKGAYLRSFGASPMLIHKTYAEATLIIAAFNASYCYAASLTYGEIDIYVDVMSRA